MLIEFAGTPSAGKNSVIEAIVTSFCDKKIKIIDESNVPDIFDFDIKTYELRTLWRILDTYLKINQLTDETLSNYDLILVNRGIFDRIAWSKFLSIENQGYSLVSEALEINLKKIMAHRKINLTFLMLSSYEKVRFRRLKKGLTSNHVFVNQESIERLNKIYLDLFEELQLGTQIIKIDDIKHDLSLEEKVFAISSYLIQG